MCRLFRSVLIVVWLGLPWAAFAQPEMDPNADRVFKAVHAYMSGLDSLLVNAETSEETVYGDTHKLQFGGTLKFGMQRPARFFATHRADYENRRMYLNDGTFTVFDEDVNVFAQVSASGSLDDAFARMQADYGISSPGGELFGGNAYELLVENASKVVYVGVSNVNGTACHHIAGILETMDWQLWVREEGDPELCKYVVTDRDVPMAPQYSITFEDWQANADISDRQFDFQAPADAEAIDFVR